jgi:CubicO group peptidase (beta-lactamase class C family)
MPLPIECDPVATLPVLNYSLLSSFHCDDKTQANFMHRQNYFLPLVLALAFLLPLQAVAQLSQARSSRVSVSLEHLARMDAVIAASIAKRELPGAVVLVSRKGKVVWNKAYGARVVEPAPERMTTDTIFDLASLTKVIATATSIMILVERGKVRLSDPLSTFIPEIKGGGRERITIEHLLTHRSGYAPDFYLRERWTGYD